MRWWSRRDQLPWDYSRGLGRGSWLGVACQPVAPASSWTEHNLPSVAHGEQTLCSKHRAAGGQVVACVLPAALLEALLPFAPSPAVRQRIAEALEFQSTAGEPASG
ncbi:MAG: hypothetical protein NT069_34660 [Planctomycetota bacterium]|nr:hypothetical protein [Planctomycetota bacterium]